MSFTLGNDEKGVSSNDALADNPHPLPSAPPLPPPRFLLVTPHPLPYPLFGVFCCFARRKPPEGFILRSHIRFFV